MDTFEYDSMYDNRISLLTINGGLGWGTISMESVGWLKIQIIHVRQSFNLAA